VPFRPGARLVSGIDLPGLTVGVLRDEIEAAFRQPGAAGATLVFSCRHGARPAVRDGVVDFELPCAGMLPPSFAEYGLRAGAAGVVVATCAMGDCEYRFGVRWTVERIAGSREPRLRRAVDRARVMLIPAGREDGAALDAGIEEFGSRLAAAGLASKAGDDRRRAFGEHGHG
jgi:coenzyme F420-reducing hydrogenase delta subunit